MNKKSVIGFILIIGFAGMLLYSFGGQVGGYMSFDEAAEKNSRAHVVGQWVETQEINYNPEQNLFTFYMQDEKGAVKKVEYRDTKPANFEDAEKVVVEGFVRNDDVFEAEHILVKCPSKYEAEAPGVDI